MVDVLSNFVAAVPGGKFTPNFSREQSAGADLEGEFPRDQLVAFLSDLVKYDVVRFVERHKC